jgi:spore maturation protein CgeB
MKIVVFGLSLSSSWGNGHATVWRSLLAALKRRGHESVFFERDTRYYAAHRDLRSPRYADLHIYSTWESIQESARREANGADVAVVTSYCADAIVASTLVLESRARLRVFYDLDTPVTLASVAERSPVFYLPHEGLAGFDLVFSFTGGEALKQLETRLGARRTAVLYGSVDPDEYRPCERVDRFAGDLSYLGTYASDRQPLLDQLFFEAAKRSPRRRFVIGGSLYPKQCPWSENIYYIPHVPPPEHLRFYSSSPMTLNVTRTAMAMMGFCPSGRLFEAAACGAALLSDQWEGIEEFFEPGSEIVIVNKTTDTVAALDCERDWIGAVARRARERTLDEHTGMRRAIEFERAVEAASRST